MGLELGIIVKKEFGFISILIFCAYVRVDVYILWVVEIQLKRQFVLCTEARSQAQVCDHGEINHRESHSVCELGVLCIPRQVVPLSSFGQVPISNMLCPHKYTPSCQASVWKIQSLYTFYKLLFLSNYISRIHQIYQKYTLEVSVSLNRTLYVCIISDQYKFLWAQSMGKIHPSFLSRLQMA